MDNLVVLCQEGYEVYAGVQSTETDCMSNGSWTPNITCSSKLSCISTTVQRYLENVSN